MIKPSSNVLIESLIEAVWLVDAVTLRIVQVNQAAADLVGMERSDMLDKAAIELTATPEAADRAGCCAGCRRSSYARDRRSGLPPSQWQARARSPVA